MDLQRIGACLKQLRREKGLTQEQLAERFGVSGRTVSRWENGVHMPDIELILELAEFYDVDLRYLLKGEAVKEGMTRQTTETVQEVAKYGRVKERIKRIGRGILIGLLALAALLTSLAMLLHISFPFLACAAVEGEYEEAIASLNNPYINDGLEGWKKAELDNGAFFKIPNEWNAERNGNRITITCGDEVIAQGVGITPEEALRTADPSDAGAEEYYDFEDCEAARAFNEETFSVSGRSEWESLYHIHTSMLADYGLLTITDEDGRTETHYRIEMHYHPGARQNYWVFDFGEKKSGEDPMLHYVEAIAYSYDRPGD